MLELLNACLFLKIPRPYKAIKHSTVEGNRAAADAAREAARKPAANGFKRKKNSTAGKGNRQSP